MEYDDIKDQFHQYRDSKKVLEEVYKSMKTDLDAKKYKKKSKLGKLFTKKSKIPKPEVNVKAVPSCVPEPEVAKKSVSDSKHLIPATVKHETPKLKQSVSSQDNSGSLSDKEQEEGSSRSKSRFRFGFSKSKSSANRSKSTMKPKAVLKQEISQIEKDLALIESKISHSENLKNMIQEDYLEKRNKFKEATEHFEELKKYKEEASHQMCGFLYMYELKRKHTLKDLTEKLNDVPERIDPH